MKLTIPDLVDWEKIMQAGACYILGRRESPSPNTADYKQVGVNCELQVGIFNTGEFEECNIDTTVWVIEKVHSKGFE